MPNSANPMEQPMEKYRAMTSEQLQQLLRNDALENEGEEKLTDLLCAMEVLAQRRKEQNPGRTPEEALEEFQKHYLEAEEASETEREQAIPGKRSAFSVWFKGVAAAAAIFVLLFTGMMTAKAIGFDPWGIFVEWTKETFILHYETPPTMASIPVESLPDPTATYNSLEEALEAYYMDSTIIPTWIPEDYQLREVTTFASETWRHIEAGYESEKGSLTISVMDYTGVTEIEQSGGTCEIYHRNGLDYYLVQNNREHYAVWLVDDYECFVGGTLSVEELKQMIDSIKKG